MQRNISPMLAFLLGVVVVGLGVLGYLLYERQHRKVVTIDVPGFSGEITKDKRRRRYRGRQGPLVFFIPSFRRKPESRAIGSERATLDTGFRRYDEILRHQHRGAGQFALAQACQRVVGGMERHRGDAGLDRDVRRERQEFTRVGAGEIGDRAQHALVPQDRRRESSGCRSYGCRRTPRRRPCARR